MFNAVGIFSVLIKLDLSFENTVHISIVIVPSSNGQTG
jgi:hypothetical protein